MTYKVLIIGGTGYVGSRLTLELSKSYKVDTVDAGWFNTSTPTILRDFNTLTKEELREYEAIVLLAGHSSVKTCDGPIEGPWVNNVTNFANLVSKMHHSQTLIYASSSSVYGNNAPGVVSAEHNYSFYPVNNYDITKYVLDLHAKSYISQGKKIVGLRFGTVNGWSPHIRGDLMLNSMLLSAKNTGAVNVTNKHISRAILGLGDLCRGIRACIETPFPGIFNLASFNSTVDKMSTIVADMTGTKVVDHGNLGNVYDFGIDVSKFKLAYGFTPMDSPETLVDELARGYQNSLITRRDDYIVYNGK